MGGCGFLMLGFSLLCDTFVLGHRGVCWGL